MTVRKFSVDSLYLYVSIIMLVVTPVIDILGGLAADEEAETTTVNQIIRLAWLIACIIYIAYRCSRREKSVIAFVPMLLFIAYQTIVEMFAGDPFRAVVSSGKVLTFIVSIIVIYLAGKTQSIKISTFQKAAFLGFIITAVLVLGGGIGGLGLRNAYKGSSELGLVGTGTFFFSETIPAFLLLIYAPLLYYRVTGLKFVLLTVGICVLATLTYVRTALVAYAFGIIFYTLYDKSNSYLRLNRTVKIVAILFFVGCSILLLALYCPDLFLRWTDSSGSGRADFQVLALTAVMKSPLEDIMLGHGFDWLQNGLQNSYGARIGTHNDLLDIFAAYGFFGLGLWIWGWVSILKPFIIRHLQKRSTPFLPVVMFAVVVFFAFSMLHGARYYVGPMYIFGVILGLGYISTIDQGKNVQH